MSNIVRRVAARSVPIDNQKFDKSLHRIWTKSGFQRRMGLAISGGVDSMALASLCSATRQNWSSMHKLDFTAFIIDHCLREGSSLEAEKVSCQLKLLNIDTKILKLDWSMITHDPSRLTNLETHARALRFHTLGVACRDANINSLLLAHHAGDQAETVLARLVTGYTGAGFRGILPEGQLPECEGIYGVWNSGSPRKLLPTRLGTSGSPLPIEGGGINVYRPLLEYCKDRLIATCRRDRVRWFEDPTNTDVTLTLRNTLRHLWAQNKLPRALGQLSMIKLAERVERRVQGREAVAESIFNKCKIELDVRSGSLILQTPADIKEQLFAPTRGSEERAQGSEAGYRAAILLRKVFSLVSPKAKMPLTTLLTHVDEMFPLAFSRKDTELPLGNQALQALYSLRIIRTVSQKSLFPRESEVIQEKQSSGSMALYTPGAHTRTIPPHHADIVFRIERAQVPRKYFQDMTKVLVRSEGKRQASTDIGWTDWQLFDGRFWIRLRHRPFNLSPDRSVVIRFLQPDDLERLYKTLDRENKAFIKGRLMYWASGDQRFTLPAIVERREVRHVRDRKQIAEDICALPTIGWGRDGWRLWTGKDSTRVAWSWECNYKKIEFGKGQGHTMKAPDVLVKSKLSYPL